MIFSFEFWLDRRFFFLSTARLALRTILIISFTLLFSDPAFICFEICGMLLGKSVFSLFDELSALLGPFSCLFLTFFSMLTCLLAVRFSVDDVGFSGCDG